MVEQQDDIRIAIENGLFDEGLYLISEEYLNKSVEPVRQTAHIQVADDTEKHKRSELINEPAEPENTTEINTRPELIAEQIAISPEIPEVALEAVSAGEAGIIETEDVVFGGNRKGVAILVHYTDEKFIYFRDKIILEKILESVKLVFDDVLLINTHSYCPSSLAELQQKFGIGKLLGFGINEPFASNLKRDVPEKGEGISIFLMTASLGEIAMDKTKKRLLWENLKIMFSIV